MVKDTRVYYPLVASGKNLVGCPDCGQMISRKARACPECGRPGAGRAAVASQAEPVTWKQAKPFVFSGAILFVVALAIGVAFNLADDITIENASGQSRDFIVVWYSDFWTGGGNVERCSVELAPQATTKCDPVTSYVPSTGTLGRAVDVTHVSVRWWEADGGNQTLYSVACGTDGLSRVVVHEERGKCVQDGRIIDVQRQSLVTL